MESGREILRELVPIEVDDIERLMAERVTSDSALRMPGEPVP